MEPTFLCSACEESLPSSSFYARSSSDDRPRNACKECYAKKYATKPRDPQLKWEADLNRIYGLTADEYESMLLSQGGGCAVCGERPKENRRLAVDHCHFDSTNRGLLCDKHNMGIGQFQDSPRLLRAAADYIEKHMAEMGFTEECK